MAPQAKLLGLAGSLTDPTKPVIRPGRRKGGFVKQTKRELGESLGAGTPTDTPAVAPATTKALPSMKRAPKVPILKGIKF